MPSHQAPCRQWMLAATLGPMSMLIRLTSRAGHCPAVTYRDRYECRNPALTICAAAQCPACDCDKGRRPFDMASITCNVNDYGAVTQRNQLSTRWSCHLHGHPGQGGAG
jgi:hypothetical protein